jgi:hypothetical protein
MLLHDGNTLSSQSYVIITNDCISYYAVRDSDVVLERYYISV